MGAETFMASSKALLGRSEGRQRYTSFSTGSMPSQGGKPIRSVKDRRIRPPGEKRPAVSASSPSVMALHRSGLRSMATEERVAPVPAALNQQTCPARDKTSSTDHWSSA
jgi:hypothetical protein